MTVIKKYAKTHDQVSEILDRMAQVENALYDGYELVMRYGAQYLRLLFKVKDPTKAWWWAFTNYDQAWGHQGMVTAVLLEECTAMVLDNAKWKGILKMHDAELQTPQKMQRDFPENFEEVMSAINKIAIPNVELQIEKNAEALEARAIAVGLEEDASEEEIIRAEELKQHQNTK